MTTVVCHDKIYQSGNNIRQLLTDKVVSNDSEQIVTINKELQTGQSISIPACKFIHFHSNYPVSVELNGSDSPITATFLSCDFGLNSIALTAENDLPTSIYIVYVE